MPAEKPRDGVLVEGALRPVLCEFVTIPASLRELSPPLRVGDGGALDVEVHSEGGLPTQVRGVGIDVDLVVRGHHLHLLQDTSEIAHPAGNVALEVRELTKELEDVILIRVEDAVAIAEPVDAVKVKGVTLVAPEGADIAEISSALENAEDVVGVVLPSGGKERSHTSKGAKSFKRRSHLDQLISGSIFIGYLNLAADLLGSLKGGDLFVHVGLAPAASSEVVHVDPLHDLLHRRALPVGEGGQQPKEKNTESPHLSVYPGTDQAAYQAMPYKGWCTYCTTTKATVCVATCGSSGRCSRWPHPPTHSGVVNGDDEAKTKEDPRLHNTQHPKPTPA